MKLRYKIFRKCRRPLFSDGIPDKIRVFSKEVEVFQTTNELGRLFCNNSLHVGPCDRGPSGM